MTRVPIAATHASLPLPPFLPVLPFLTFLSFLPVLSGCSREPVPPHSWLGTVAPVATPAATGARFPHLATDGQSVVMSWLEPGPGDEFRLRYAEWQRTQRWGTPVDVASGNDWFINWADFPSVVPAVDGPWTAHWLRQKPGGT